MSSTNTDTQLAKNKDVKLIDDTVSDSKLHQENSDTVEKYIKKSKKNISYINVKVHSPFKEYFNGEAFSFSAENLSGPFDVLPGHHNFISLLSACNLIIRTVQGEQKIQITSGLLHVKANQVVVFLDV